jgi:putative protease
MPLSITAADELRLEQVYSRGFGPHFLTGTNHQAVVRGRAPRHRGVLAGKVLRASADTVVIEPSLAHEIAPLKPGDGVVFDAASWRSPEEPEEGGRLYSVQPGDMGELHLRFARGSITPSRIRPGDLLWRTDDPDLARTVRQYLEPSSPVSRQPLVVTVIAREGEPLGLECSLERRPEIRCEIVSDDSLSTSRSGATPPARLREQIERLGNTPYELARCEIETTGRPFVPVSLLNRLRREAVERLAQLQAQTPMRRVFDPAAALSSLLASQPERARADDIAPQIHLLVRTPEQLDAAIAAAPASVTLDYLDLYGLKTSLDRIRAAGLEPRVAAPRVLKPGENRIIDFLARLDCPILVRSAGLLEIMRSRRHGPLTGDFSLNAANAISAALFLDIGLERITPTHDLNAAQIADLARSAGPLRIEAVAYQHLPVFHTEHCVFCRFLSAGTTYKDCGRPCEKHSVELQDFSGRRHPVMADVGCRNTVFGAEAQEASAHMESWLGSGIRHFRLEFVHESSGQVARIAHLFRAALEGRKPISELSRELKRTAPQGTTEGSLFIARDYRTLPVLQ